MKGPFIRLTLVPTAENGAITSEVRPAWFVRTERISDVAATFDMDLAGAGARSAIELEAIQGEEDITIEWVTETPGQVIERIMQAEREWGQHGTS